MLQNLPSWPPVKVWLSNFKNEHISTNEKYINIINNHKNQAWCISPIYKSVHWITSKAGWLLYPQGRQEVSSQQSWSARGGYKWAMYCTLSIPHSLPQSKQKEKAIHSHFSAEVCFWLVICPLQVYLVWFNNTVCMTTTAWQQVSPKDNL